MYWCDERVHRHKNRKSSRIMAAVFSAFWDIFLTTCWRLFEWNLCSWRWREPTLFLSGSRREPRRCWARTGPSTAAGHASCVPSHNRGSPRGWLWTIHLLWNTTVNFRRTFVLSIILRDKIQEIKCTAHTDLVYYCDAGSSRCERRHTQVVKRDETSKRGWIW